MPTIMHGENLKEHDFGEGEEVRKGKGDIHRSINI